ncbi:MAG TPA: cell wall-binding repeat-containing protein, partial [Euzebya sp.]|nr:cell wall-binding repeat-containing protein [Euzebya sp.]
MDRMLLTGRLPRLLAISLLMLGLLVLPAAGQEDTSIEDPTTEEGEDTAEDEESDSRGAPASRGNARLDTGEVSGRLAPAVSQPGQQVTVHAVTQLFDHPGGGRPDHAGGRPDHAGGQPLDRPDNGNGPRNAQDALEEEPAGEDIPDDGVTTEHDTTTEDGQALDVTFTVDYGDGSAVEDMRPTKTRGRDGARRAIAHHTYAEEGAYAVTITATPLEGEPATIELVAQVGSGAARLDGDSRIETAVAISQDSFEDGSADAVVLARADAFADALAASTLAFVSNAPVLLTGSTDLPAVVQDEIER